MTDKHVIAARNAAGWLTEEQVRQQLAATCQRWKLHGQRVLVLIPDGTRTAATPLLFRLLHEVLNGQVAALDYLIALGTHPPLDERAIDGLLGLQPGQRREEFPGVRVLNHHWDRPETFVQVGEISAAEAEELSGGLLSERVPVRLNRLALDYDLLLVCGPVFPHEVVGFSGGNKYIFPGISGPEMINFTHWLGALLTSYTLIGRRHTPVRAVIDRAAAFIPRRRLALCQVMDGERLAGLYAGTPESAWAQAAAHSAQLHVRYVERPYRRVLSVMPHLYDDLWTGAKGMYKLEPVVADGGEVIIYAPHITEISYTHGAIIDEVGYHVRDYFLKQWPRFKDYPRSVLAHSTHLRGIGEYKNGIERPRIQVTLATGIPPERCRQVNLGYLDPETIDPAAWQDREEEGLLLVPHAGEMLYRLNGHSTA